LRRHVTSAVWAAVITVFVGDPSGRGRRCCHQRCTGCTGWEIVPMLAANTLSIAGRTGGPEGLPPIPEIILLTFVLWWAIVELSVRCGAACERGAHPNQPDQCGDRPRLGMTVAVKPRRSRSSCQTTTQLENTQRQPSASGGGDGCECYDPGHEFTRSAAWRTRDRTRSSGSARRRGRCSRSRIRMAATSSQGRRPEV
jgi:hypothetical protein